MLSIKNLHASVDETEILKGLTLDLEAGSIHALMGPNGSGKSTLAHVIAGHPGYTVTEGSITVGTHDILPFTPTERALSGIFLAFQYPASIPGVPVSQFLRLALNAKERSQDVAPTPMATFIRELRGYMKLLHMPMSVAERSVNEGFSGGEKKRLEMLQMLVLKPQLVMLDEIDSGLDIDAMKLVATAVEALRAEQPQTTFLVITHYDRILELVTPDHVHIMKNGQIVKSGGPELAKQLEQTGYEKI